MSPSHQDRSIRILYLTHSCPYPPHSGDRIRNFNILRYLSQRYTVHLIYPSFLPADLGQVGELEKYCASAQTVHLHPLLSKLRVAFGLFTQTPLTVWHFYSRHLKSLVYKTECDLILVDCSSMAQYVMDINKPRIIDFVDVDYNKWLLYAEKASFLKSIIYVLEYLKLKKFEYTVGKLFNHCIVVSENEKKLLPCIDHISVIPNGMDFDLPGKTKQSEDNFIIFIGVMNYFPNIDGVLFFHDQILPLIKNKIDNVKFIIAGMNPVKEIRKLHSKDVTVTGFVPDIRSYLAQASVCVVPLRIAKGIQNKVLEAMAMEVPVVATPVANQGIKAQHHREIMIAENPPAFAEATVDLLCDAGLRKDITANAKTFVMKKYRWEVNLQKLDEVISSLMTPEGQHEYEPI